ncbi:DUF4352 domain-containing protein [Shimazuella sp. AN120528]|uniref:DUF4352 domain-containing protein n=1 Tax=Shimazuella soli TaxID=1892854 RepID=UPI001F0DFE9E|nr:DUF4352 domain-containing protein [Shimazuella soli]MCH5583783.1 DUF4352 domain-containing protein [Shimazuella soli]
MKLGFFTALLLVVLTACQPVDTTLPKANMKENYMRPDSPDPIAGDYVKARPFSIVMTDIQQKKQLTLNGINHKAKIAYLMVSIGIINQSSEPIMIEPSMFRLVDDHGKTYQPDVSLDLLVNGSGEGFFHQKLEPLERKNVTLLFDTSLNINQGYLEITGGPHSIKKAHIRLLQ